MPMNLHQSAPAECVRPGSTFDSPSIKKNILLGRGLWGWNPSESITQPWVALRFPILTWQVGPAAEALPPQTRPEVEDIGAAKLSGQTPYIIDL